MELRTKNIHMDGIRAKASTQITIEDDINIPDSKPDVERILLERGCITVEECRVLSNQVAIRGKLNFAMLYVSEEDDHGLTGMQGSIPIDELLNVEQINAEDMIVTDVKMEDLTIVMINSRKISVRCIAILTLHQDALCDLRIPVEAVDAENAESHMIRRKYRESVVMKKDHVRIRDRVELPKNYPNIGNLLWQEANIAWIDYRCQNNAIRVQGELDEFLLYVSDSEEPTVQFYENTYSFNQTLDCSGVGEGMIPIIDHHEVEPVITVETDSDGERRNIAIDIPLDLEIRVYEETEYPVLEDIYATDRRIDTSIGNTEYRSVCFRNLMKQRVAERIQLAEENPDILQLIRCRGEIAVDKMTLNKDGLEIGGNIAISALYLGGEESGYHVVRQDFPIDYVVDVQGITETANCNVEPSIEQISAVPADGRQVDVKLIVCFKTTVYRRECAKLISDITEDRSSVVGDELPGMALYVVKAGDSLWKIGKKYCVSIQKLKEYNQLTEDDIYPGQKLLVVR